MSAMSDCRWRIAPADEENDHEWCETHGDDWPCRSVRPMPGSPLARHDTACESGYVYGPWSDCDCLRRAAASSWTCKCEGCWCCGGGEVGCLCDVDFEKMQTQA